MPTFLKVKVPFSWAHRGVDVKHYEAGQVIETEEEDLVSVSVAEGWAVKTKEPKADATKAGEGDNTAE